jgi:hypothetical protein
MKQLNRHWFAAWMFVPLALLVPAVISGLSIWNDWGPHWLMLSIAATAGLLALLIDRRHAWRWGAVGGAIGLVTSPLLLLLGRANWSAFGWWVTICALAAALVLPLVWDGAPNRH